MCRRYSWAVPDNKTLKTIAAYSPLIEIGAGGGYWASLLHAIGADIIAFDQKPYSNYYVDCRHFEVKRGGYSTVRHYPERTLFVCWPIRDAQNALKQGLNRHYQKDLMLYIGDPLGCTCRMPANWIAEDMIDIPQWKGMYDGLFIYRRRR